MEAARFLEANKDATRDDELELQPFGPRLRQAAVPVATTAGIGALRVLGTRVDAVAGSEVLAALADRSYSRPRHLCYVNAHSLNVAYRNEAYRAALSRADLVLNDGIGIELAARMRGRRFPENLNGSDFTLRLLSLAAERRWRVYLYGGQPGVADNARERLCERIEGLEIVGVCDGYGTTTEDALKDIRSVCADVLVVALGQPRQELWLDHNLSATGCHLGLGVGAFLDFASGRVVRAPGWMNRVGVEWLFRLAQEPGRLWRRYIVGNPLFLWRAWRLRAVEVDWLAHRRARGVEDAFPPRAGGAVRQEPLGPAATSFSSQRRLRSVRPLVEGEID